MELLLGRSGRTIGEGRFSRTDGVLRAGSERLDADGEEEPDDELPAGFGRCGIGFVAGAGVTWRTCPLLSCTYCGVSPFGEVLNVEAPPF